MENGKERRKGEENERKREKKQGKKRSQFTFLATPVSTVLLEKESRPTKEDET